MKMDETDFAETVDATEELIQGIGYPETDRLELPPPPEEQSDKDTENGESAESPGEVVVATTDAGPNFAVIARRSEAYFEVQSTYPLWQDIANALTPEKATEIIPESIREEVPEEHPARNEVVFEEFEDEDQRLQVLGAFELLRGVDIEVRKEVLYQLSKIFTRAEVKHVVNSPDEKAAPHEFSVQYKIFPYDDDFGFQELNETVEKVRMAAHRGTLYLRYAFNLGVDIDRNTAGDVGSDPNPPSENGDLADVDEIEP